LLAGPLLACPSQYRQLSIFLALNSLFLTFGMQDTHQDTHPENIGM
jgi:hypothetical protein